MRAICEELLVSSPFCPLGEGIEERVCRIGSGNRSGQCGFERDHAAIEFAGAVFVLLNGRPIQVEQHAKPNLIVQIKDRRIRDRAREQFGGKQERSLPALFEQLVYRGFIRERQSHSDWLALFNRFRNGSWICNHYPRAPQRSEHKLVDRVLFH